jgi:hypothetical protein
MATGNNASLHMGKQYVAAAGLVQVFLFFVAFFGAAVTIRLLMVTVRDCRGRDRNARSVSMHANLG